MTGVSLSRWTMSYFAAALIALVAAEILMLAGFGFPSHALRAPETLILVHIVAIGWLSLLMCGALFQFVPVLVARPLHSNKAPLPALLCLVGGLVALLLGFLQLAGHVDLGSFPFPAASVLLGVGFLIALWNLGRTLWPARPLPLPARFVAVGLLSLAATVTYGIIFALALAGVITADPVLSIAATGLPFHIAAGLGGWLTFTAMGVSYRLLAMFMLAPELDGWRPKAVFHLGAAALAVAVLGGGTVSALGLENDLVLGLAGALGIISLMLYGADLAFLYRTRKRRAIELNSRMVVFSLTSLAAAVLLMLALVMLDRFEDHVGAVIFLFAFGWLSGLGLAKLYKIVPFLTWLECYGPVLGKTVTPRVQDLVTEPRAIKWFLAYFLAVWSATAALLLQLTPAFQVAAGGMLFATIGIIAQLVRSRRLSDVAEERRLPGNARRPRLLLSLVPKS